MATDNTTTVSSVALILAAGASSRMKQSKQLLKINGESLLRKTIAVTKDSNIGNIVVVLGANEAQHREEIADTATVVFNPEWQNGMGSSLKSGIGFIAQEFPSAEVVIVLVCDQPLLTSAHLKNLIEEWKLTKSPIVASRYSGSPGVPVLFHPSFYKDILSIEDEHGAKKLVTKHLGQATLVDFPEGAIDLDTPEDLKNFVQRKP